MVRVVEEDGQAAGARRDGSSPRAWRRPPRTGPAAARCRAPERSAAPPPAGRGARPDPPSRVPSRARARRTAGRARPPPRRLGRRTSPPPGSRRSRAAWSSRSPARRRAGGHRCGPAGPPPRARRGLAVRTPAPRAPAESRNRRDPLGSASRCGSARLGRHPDAAGTPRTRRWAYRHPRDTGRPASGRPERRTTTMTAVTSPPAVDGDVLMGFVFRAVDEVGATLNAALVVMGDQLGYYRALAEHGPAHAARAGRAHQHRRALRPRVAQRPGRRRLRRRTTPTTGRYTLPAGARGRADRRDSPAFLPGFFQIALGTVRDAPADRRGRRAAAPASAGTSTTTTCYEGCERFFRPGYHANLVAVVAARRSTASSAKLESGRTRRRRRLRPRRLDDPDGAGVPGLDVRRLRLPRGLDRDRPRAGRGGRRRRARRVRGRAAPTAFTGPGYDLVTMFDCLHDMGDPVGAARHVRDALADDGTWMIVEPSRRRPRRGQPQPGRPRLLRVLDAALHAGVAVAGGRARARRAGRRRRASATSSRRPASRRFRRVRRDARSTSSSRSRKWHSTPARQLSAHEPVRAPASGIARAGCRRARRRPDRRTRSTATATDGPAAADLVDHPLAALEGAGPVPRAPLPGRHVRRPRQRPLGPPGGRRGVRRARSTPPTRSPSWTPPGPTRAVLVGLSCGAQLGAARSPPTTRSASAAVFDRAGRAAARSTSRARDRDSLAERPLDTTRAGRSTTATTGSRATTTASSSSSSPRCSPSRTRPSRSRTASAGGSRRRRDAGRHDRGAGSARRRDRESVEPLCAGSRCPVLVIHGDRGPRSGRTPTASALAELTGGELVHRSRAPATGRTRATRCWSTC